MLLSTLLETIEYRSSVEEREVFHITNNSLEAHAGSIFVCVKGFATDGHIFARKAYEKGCRVFVCEYIPADLPSEATVILVESSRKALALLACELYGHPSHRLLTIGITGTKGKTTSALMIKQLLDASGIPAGYIGSNGVLYGDTKLETKNTTPESYMLQKYMSDMVSSGMRAVVMEISSQALKFNRVLGVKLDVALFTNFSPDHIGPGEHPNLEDYFESKKALFDKFAPSLVIANADDDYTEKVLADSVAKKIFYSTENSADYRATDIKPCKIDGSLGMSFTCHHGSGATPYSLSVPGEFNIHNALSTIAVAREMGIDENKIASALSGMRIDGRFETVATQSGACFVIDYAHNGLSLTSALTALRKYNPARLICLFGSVGCRTQVRRAQMGEAASRYADFSIITSDNPDTENPEKIMSEIAAQFEGSDSFVCIADREEAIRYAFDMAQKDDIILLAGKGHERYQLINGKKEYFCEREIIENCMNEVTLIK